MVKSKRLAYDGRGNAVAKTSEELSSAVAGNHIPSLFLPLPFVILRVPSFWSYSPFLA